MTSPTIVLPTVVEGRQRVVQVHIKTEQYNWPSDLGRVYKVINTHVLEWDPTDSQAWHPVQYSYRQDDSPLMRHMRYIRYFRMRAQSDPNHAREAYGWNVTYEPNGDTEAQIGYLNDAAKAAAFFGKRWAKAATVYHDCQGSGVHVARYAYGVGASRVAVYNHDVSDQPVWFTDLHQLVAHVDSIIDTFFAPPEGVAAHASA